MGFLIRMAITAVGLWLADHFISGISVDAPETLLWAALLLGLVNAFVRPIAVFMTFPFTLLTMGLFLWVINGAMLGLVSWMLTGFRIDGLWSAMLGSVVVGLTGWIANAFISDNGRYEVVRIKG